MILGIVFTFYQYNHNSKISEVCVRDNCFSVELAQTPEERATGLMNREFLAENEGMLFIFPEEGDYGFWMKDTLIPLDMIWINQNLEIVNIATAQPCNEVCPIIRSKDPALYVLELNAGITSQLGIIKKEKVIIKK
ncbi:hypothetical protein AUJ84_02400 [Candidatus Pacearchaeota archaeon CG1_02_32_132]|nr:MAG: hypothetical protein AUJ84_02400 [Candidatus Pacearchaeota archaeon CG1_02_32_132]